MAARNIGRIAVVLDGMDLTDVQWAVLEPTFRPRVARMGAAGRGPIRGPS
jgi:hypothetical protein